MSEKAIRAMRPRQCRGVEPATDDIDGIYFDDRDPGGRLILWETSTPAGLEFEVSDGEQTIVCEYRWAEIERLHEALGARLKARAAEIA